MSLTDLLLTSSNEGVADLLRFDFDLDDDNSPSRSPSTRAPPHADVESKTLSEDGTYSSDASLDTLPGKSAVLTSSVNVEVIEKLYRSLSQPLNPTTPPPVGMPSPESPYERDRRMTLSQRAREGGQSADCSYGDTPPALRHSSPTGSPRSPMGSPTREQREVMSLRGAAEKAVRTESFLKEELLVAQQIANSYKQQVEALEAKNKDYAQQLHDTLELHAEKEKEYLTKYLQQEGEIAAANEAATAERAQAQNYADNLLNLQMEIKELNKKALASSTILQKEEELIVKENAFIEKVRQHEIALQTASEDVSKMESVRKQNMVQSQLISQLESDLELRAHELTSADHLKGKVLHHEAIIRELQRDKVIHDEEKLRLRELHSEQVETLELMNYESSTRAACLDTTLKCELMKQSELQESLQTCTIQLNKSMEENRYLEQVYARVKAGNDAMESTKIHAAALSEVEVHQLRDQLHELITTSSALRERLVSKEEEVTSLRREVGHLQAKMFEIQRTPKKGAVSMNSLSPTRTVNMTSVGRSVSPLRMHDDFQSPYGATPHRESTIATDMKSCDPVEAPSIAPSVPPVPFTGIDPPDTAPPQYDQLFRSRGISPPRMSLHDAKSFIRSYSTPPQTRGELT